MKDQPSNEEELLPHSIHSLLQSKTTDSTPNTSATTTASSAEPVLSTFNLFGVPLVCLVLNGEERLCLAQISSRLLRQHSYNEIHNRRVALGITCVQCSPRQLEALRRVGAMPLSSRRCGTITKREAQRLVESFLQQHMPAANHVMPRHRLPQNFAFEVVHHCGWGCSGFFVPARYNSSRAKCVQCGFCRVFFSPNKFIFHCHSSAETGMKPHISPYRHPDAANFNAWRRHLQLSDPNPPESLLFAWEDIKALFNGGNRSKKPPISSSTNGEKEGPGLATLPVNPMLLSPPPALFASLIGSRSPPITPGVGLWWMNPPPALQMPFPIGNLSNWGANLKEYLDKVTQGIFLPPPPPPSSSN